METTNEKDGKLTLFLNTNENSFLMIEKNRTKPNETERWTNEMKTFERVHLFL